MISVNTFQAEPGDTIEVAGEAWISGCDDSGGSAGGCASSDEEEEPMTGIQLRLKGPRTDQTDQDLSVGEIGETDVAILLGTVDADGEGAFRRTVTIPDVPPGRYFLTGIGTVPASRPPQIQIVRH